MYNCQFYFERKILKDVELEDEIQGTPQTELVLDAFLQYLEGDDLRILKKRARRTVFHGEEKLGKIEYVGLGGLEEKALFYISWFQDNLPNGDPADALAGFEAYLNTVYMPWFVDQVKEMRRHKAAIEIIRKGLPIEVD